MVLEEVLVVDTVVATVVEVVEVPEFFCLYTLIVLVVDNWRAGIVTVVVWSNPTNKIYSFPFAFTDIFSILYFSLKISKTSLVFSPEERNEFVTHGILLVNKNLLGSVYITFVEERVNTGVESNDIALYTPSDAFVRPGEHVATTKLSFNDRKV